MVPVPVPDVASVVVGAGALQRGSIGPAHSVVRYQGGIWLGVRQFVAASYVLVLLVLCTRGLCG